uniref:Uncharacterized protein n=1 Tax=Oryza brachyantha TaxID=4533 RepID=J3MQ94_ORYBR
MSVMGLPECRQAMSPDAGVALQDAYHVVAHVGATVGSDEDGVEEAGMASCMSCSPKPYSPVSMYVLKYHAPVGSMYGIHSSDAMPL